MLTEEQSKKLDAIEEEYVNRQMKESQPGYPGIHSRYIQDVERLSDKIGNDIELQQEMLTKYTNLSKARYSTEFMTDLCFNLDPYLEKIDCDTMTDREKRLLSLSFTDHIAKNLVYLEARETAVEDGINEKLAPKQSISMDALKDDANGNIERDERPPSLMGTIAEFFQKVYREIVTGLESAFSGKPLDQVKEAYDNSARAPARK